MWSTLWLCILSALACEVQAEGGEGGEDGRQPGATPPPPPPAVRRTSVKNAADFFPFQLNGDVDLVADLAPDTEIISYNKPGFATLYRDFSGNFIIPLHPSCVAKETPAALFLRHQDCKRLSNQKRFIEKTHRDLTLLTKHNQKLKGSLIL